MAKKKISKCKLLIKNAAHNNYWVDLIINRVRGFEAQVAQQKQE